MPANLIFESSFGDRANITLPDNETARARLLLTDLPTPIGVELSINGNVVTQGKWSGTTDYEMFFPVKNLSDGTYVFQATVFFNNHPSVVSNKATLHVASEGSDLTKQVSSSSMTPTSAKPFKVSLTRTEKIAIGIGLSGVAGLVAYAFISGKA